MSDDEKTFRVVANHEEQYSIWPAHKDVPEGWVAVGPEGAKDTCLDYIERVWTDMRPRSLRLETRDSAMEQAQESGAEERSDDELQAVIDGTLSQYEDRVDAYADGRPELFGWFLARILESMGDEEVNPDEVRIHLDAQLPNTYVPDDYA